MAQLAILWALYWFMSARRRAALARQDFDAGSKHFQRRRYKKAAHSFRRVLVLAPEHMQACYFLASSLEASGDPNKAHSWFVKQVDVDKSKFGAGSAEHGVSLHNLAANALWRKNFRDAVRYAEDAVRCAEGTDGVAGRLLPKLVILSRGHWGDGDPEAATRCLEKALRLTHSAEDVKALGQAVSLACRYAKVGACRLETSPYRAAIEELFMRTDILGEFDLDRLMGDLEALTAAIDEVRASIDQIAFRKNPLTI